MFGKGILAKLLKFVYNRLSLSRISKGSRNLLTMEKRIWRRRGIWEGTKIFVREMFEIKRVKTNS